MEYLSRLYKDVEKSQQNPVNSFDSLTLEFGPASYLYEAMSSPSNVAQQGKFQLEMFL